ncbi:MAG TPA: zf-HC2 domain-containing protein [Methylophilaceae bacterium]
MLSCKQASQLISQSLDRKLSWRERIGLRLHLLICDVCTRFRKQLQIMRNYVRQMRDEIEQDETLQIPVGAKTRIATVLASRIGDSAHQDGHHDH